MREIINYKKTMELLHRIWDGEISASLSGIEYHNSEMVEACRANRQLETQLAECQRENAELKDKLKEMTTCMRVAREQYQKVLELKNK